MKLDANYVSEELYDEILKAIKNENGIVEGRILGPLLKFCSIELRMMVLR